MESQKPIKLLKKTSSNNDLSKKETIRKKNKDIKTEKPITSFSINAFTMMNTVNTEFSYAEVWFTDQYSKALEIEDNVNLTISEAYNITGKNF